MMMRAASLHASDFFDEGGAGEAGLVHITRETFHELLEPGCWPVAEGGDANGDGGGGSGSDSDSDGGGGGGGGGEASSKLAPVAEGGDSSGSAAGAADIEVELVAVS